MRLHLLGLAHLPTSRMYLPCAYTQKIIRLAWMLKQEGFDVVFYGGELSEVEAAESVCVLTEAERLEVYGDYDWRSGFFKHDPKDKAHQTFNANAVREIKARLTGQDVLLCTMGNYQRPIVEALGQAVQAVEPGIGYEGVFTRFRVFESYAWMHHVYGLLAQKDGGWYDAVVPNAYAPEEFPVPDASVVQEHLLFIGRLIERKGLRLAAQVAHRNGRRLQVVGQGNLDDFHLEKHLLDNIDRIGTVTDPVKRAELYCSAHAVIAPTYYIGPFEGVVVESQFCGTPVITTDWGAFSETVEEGVTGFRCRTMKEFDRAVDSVQALSSQAIRERAIRLYSTAEVAKQYGRYFRRIEDLWGAGFYA